MGACAVLLGGGFLGKEYKKAKKSRNDIIEEVNVAGQLVRGRRADLCRLYYAQMAILDLPNSFKPGSQENTSDKIVNVLKNVEQERQRVRVLHAGRNSADSMVYDFSEMRMKLVNENPENLVQHRGPGAAPADIRHMELSRPFNEGAIQFSDALIEQLAEKLEARLAQRQNPPPKAGEDPAIPVPPVRMPLQNGKGLGHGLNT